VDLDLDKPKTTSMEDYFIWINAIERDIEDRHAIPYACSTCGNQKIPEYSCRICFNEYLDYNTLRILDKVGK
jgi:recombinational DNA repair protein RecR